MNDLKIPVRQRAKMWLGQTKRLYPLYLKWRNPRKRFPCGETFLTIEGFPRSANTFSWYLAREVFPGKLISSHIHNISSIKAGMRLGRPCAIVFRAPLESVVSLAQKDNVSPQNDAALSGYLFEWCKMHEFVLEHLDDLWLVEFSQAVGDPAAYARLLGQICGENLDYRSATAIAAESRRKMDDKEGSKPERGSSLPREERQNEKKAYFASVESLSVAPRAVALYERLREERVDLSRFSDGG